MKNNFLFINISIKIKYFIILLSFQPQNEVKNDSKNKFIINIFLKYTKFQLTFNNKLCFLYLIREKIGKFKKIVILIKSDELVI